MVFPKFLSGIHHSPKVQSKPLGYPIVSFPMGKAIIKLVKAPKILEIGVPV